MIKKILFLLLLSTLPFASFAQEFKEVSQSLMKAKSEKDGNKKFSLIYSAYQNAGSILVKNYKKSDLEKLVKSLPMAFKVHDQYEILENLTGLYQSKKKDFDALVKEHLSKEDQKKFHKHMKIAIDVATNGNG